MKINTKKELQKYRCYAALSAIMAARKINIGDLAKGTGISYRTLEGYCYGRYDLASAKAYNIIEIAHYLNVDGRILTGSRSIEDFYNEEIKRIREQADLKQELEKESEEGIFVRRPNQHFKYMYHKLSDKAKEDLDQVMEEYNRRIAMIDKNYNTDDE